MINIGLEIYDEYKLELGKSVESLKEFIRAYGIKYHCPIDICNEEIETCNLNNVLILIMLKNSGVEVKIDSGYITYIKAYNSELNFVTNIEEETNTASPTEIIKKVKTALVNKLEISESDIRIKTFDLTKLFFTFETKVSNENNITISVVTLQNKNTYIETIQYITKE